MNSFLPPYIGLTGITNLSELTKVFECTQLAGMQVSQHQLMIGYLVTPDLLHGAPPKRQRFVPDMAQLIKLAEASTSAGALTVIHFETKDEPKCGNGILEVFQRISHPGICHAVQINGTPDVADVRRVIEQFPELSLIYQIRSELIAKGTDAIIGEIISHKGAFSRVLIDPSCGAGRDMNVAESVRLARRIRSECGNITIGFAGGLCGENARDRVIELIKEFGTTDFSIDAEGKLRDEQDHLSINSVLSYFKGAVAGFLSCAQ